MSTYKYCCQYHIHRDRGNLCLDDDPRSWFVTGPQSISSDKLAAPKDYMHSTCFMFMVIGGTPKLKLHNFLWTSFNVQSVLTQSRGKVAGKGWMLNPPQILEGTEFDELFGSTVRRMFKPINTESDVARRLDDLSRRYHRPNVFDAESISFGTKLLQLIPEEPEVMKYVRYVTRQAVATAATIVSVDGPRQLLEAMDSLVQTAKDVRYSLYEADLKYVQQQFRQLKKVIDEIATPEGVDDSQTAMDQRGKLTRVAEVTVREGQDVFREQLVQAYGGRCAITGTKGELGHEAAHIVCYDGPMTNVISNGLLLRADIHRLFDNGFLAIHPDTLEVHTSQLLKHTDYKRLHGSVVRQPKRRQDRVDRAALRIRWTEFLNRN